MNAHNEQQSIIAGALFDLMGHLTCQEKKLCLSASDDAAPAVEALTEWAAKRGFDLDEARVTDWQAGLAAQPAAAQEAVAWLSPGTIERLAEDPRALHVRGLSKKREGYTVPLYAAPVTAAPVIVPDYVLADDANRLYGEGYGVDWVFEGRVSTPAAPGIDLEPAGWQYRVTAGPQTGWSPWMDGRGEKFEKDYTVERRRVYALIDASPKGATLNEQFGSAEGLGASEVLRVADHMAQVIDYIGKVYPDATMLDRGPILRNIRRWERDLRAVLADSPKGGSEARDAARYRWLRESRGTTWDQPWVAVGHYGRRWEQQPNEIEGKQLDDAIDAAMQAQASDAEVRP